MGGNSNAQEVTAINFIAYHIVVFIVGYSYIKTALYVRGYLTPADPGCDG